MMYGCMSMFGFSKEGSYIQKTNIHISFLRAMGREERQGTVFQRNNIKPSLFIFGYFFGITFLIRFASVLNNLVVKAIFRPSGDQSGIMILALA